MHKLLLTSALLLAPATALSQYTTEAVANPGKIAGKVTFSGPLPALPPERRDKNPEVCGSSHDDQTLLVGAQKGLANAIVYLREVKAGKAMTPVEAKLDQRGCTYVPHTQAVPVGSTLEILNSDALLHNIHAVSGGVTAFNYAMPQSVKQIPKRLTKAGFLTLKCDVHSWMNGTVAVMDNPYFAVTDETGAFSLDGVPPGTYTIAAWQERLGDQSQSVTVSPGATSAINFLFSAH
jgi:plastocyanin